LPFDDLDAFYQVQLWKKKNFWSKGQCVPENQAPFFAELTRVFEKSEDDTKCILLSHS
jgi:hypothetical protein